MPSCPIAGRKGATAPHRLQRGQTPVPDAGVLLIADQQTALTNCAEIEGVEGGKYAQCVPHDVVGFRAVAHQPQGRDVRKAHVRWTRARTSGLAVSTSRCPVTIMF